LLEFCHRQDFLRPPNILKVPNKCTKSYKPNVISRNEITTGVTYMQVFYGNFTMFLIVRRLFFGLWHILLAFQPHLALKYPHTVQ